MNEVKINGKITQKGVELKFASSGMAIGTFSISRSWKKKGSDDWQTEFFNVKMFGKTAEGAASLTGKVIVEGYLKQERWKKDDKEFSQVIIIANTVTPEEKKEEKPPEDECPF